MLRNALEPWHLLIVIAAIALLFGSTKLPELARGLGRSMRILKAETQAMREDDLRPDDPAGPVSAPAVEPGPIPAVEPTGVTGVTGAASPSNSPSNSPSRRTGSA
ncbi:Sec-independent protein translocase subunit TatA [Kitasatospora sp. NPDC058170]|uniref:Sec-independent protein translocase subunit TatA n=1 Tax=Kitasatospora sp. NPDC058170 TaxID=3346364 RepID=UPI0036DA3801